MDNLRMRIFSESRLKPELSQASPDGSLISPAQSHRFLTSHSISSTETILQIMHSHIEMHWRYAATIIFENRWILRVWLRCSGSNGTTDLLFPFRGRLTLAQAGTRNPSDPWDASGSFATWLQSSLFAYVVFTSSVPSLCVFFCISICRSWVNIMAVSMHMNMLWTIPK